MKKFIIAIVCLLLIFVFILSLQACATNINLIQPDNTYIVAQTPVVPSVKHWLPNQGGLVIIPLNPENYDEGIPETQINNSNTNNSNGSIQVEEESGVVVSGDDSTEVIVEDDGLIMQIFELINKAREDNGLKPLAYNYDIQEKVDIRAQECSNLFSHDRPSGKNWDTVISEVDYSIAGENLIQSDKPIATAENLVDTWMNSQGHKDNILNEKFTSTALGFFETDSTIYVAEIFLG